MHQFIHDECCTSHVAGVLHEGDKEVEYQDLRQEDDDAAHTAYDAINEHRTQRTLAHCGTYPLTQPGYARLDPIHRILSESEGHLEHHIEDEKEDRESKILVGQQVIDTVSGAISVLLRAGAEFGFSQRSMNKAVLSIHDGRLGIHSRLFKHTRTGIIAHSHQLLAVRAAMFAFYVPLDIVSHLCIVFQELDGQITGGELCTQMFIGFQELLDMGDTVLDLVAVVDVDVTCMGAQAFIDLYNGVEKFLDATPILE